MEQGGTTRTSSGNISAAIVAANAGTHPALHAPLRAGGDGRSLAEMAQRDLDATLQLLADRAQYITGANGAAIALRRGEKKDMQCRASTGSNAPELGALLSTESGLSGESVRTRQPLRCDDAERDPRVNREGCRELGIASVAVMPVVHDDEVLGVFELFSGKVNAFGERDLSALQRLSEMVETAVKLAQAAESLPERLASAMAVSSAVAAPAEGDDDHILDIGDEVAAEFVADVEEPVVEVAAEPGTPEAVTSEPVQPVVAAAAASVAEPAGISAFVPAPRMNPPPEEPVPSAQAAAVPVAPQAGPATAVPGEAAPATKPMFWSAAMNSSTDAQAEMDRSHVPPVLRSLKTCEVCGFPVSPGRALCVECEEKKWRGQLKRPIPAPWQSGKQPETTKSAASEKPIAVAPNANSVAAPASVPVARLVAAAAASAAAGASVAPAVRGVAESKTAAPAVEAKETRKNIPPVETKPVSAMPTASPDFVLSAGVAPSQSWIRANKYILGALLVVAGTVAAIVFLR